MKKNNFITNTFKETQKLGEDFAKTLGGGDVVCLYGDLGAGKTTFVQGLAKGLGIKNRIISPTFVVVRSYVLKSQKSKFKSLGPETFCHIDLYRVESKRDLESLGIEEIINNKNSIIVIEWAEKLKSYLPKERIDIEFFYKANDARKIIFRSSNQ